MILSTERNPVVLRRAEKLKIAARNALEDKAQALVEEASRRRLSMAQIWYVGNDINDMGCLKAAGLPIIVADAHEAVYPMRASLPPQAVAKALCGKSATSYNCCGRVGFGAVANDERYF